MKRKESELFDELRKIHNNKYEYIGIEKNESNKKYIRYICPIHGEIRQRLEHHKKGGGCPKCFYGSRIGVSYKPMKTQEEFLEGCKKVHGDEYDYSKTEYKGYDKKITIICHKKDENGVEHGEFLQTPTNHLRGQGCPKCRLVKIREKSIKPFDLFENKANEIHNFKYEYIKESYKGATKNMKIICPIHGEFLQTPRNHLKGCGCPKCSNVARLTIEEFIERARKIHGNRYDYSKVDLNHRNENGKVCIICPIHGKFWQKPLKHLMGQGCPKCIGKVETVEDIINKFKKVHGDKYDYSKVEFKKAKEQVCIICHKKDSNGKEHGEFYQTIDRHIQGCGCPKCNNSRLEEKFSIFLDKNEIEFNEQTRFDWLGKQTLDFYIPQYNVAIECQGLQHFLPTKHFGGKTEFEKIKKRDVEKKKLCEENGVKLLYYSNLGIKYPYEVFEDENKLLEEIKKHGKIRYK